MRAKVQHRLKCDTAGALPFIHREPCRRRRLRRTPENTKKKNWQKTAAKKQRHTHADTHTHTGREKQKQKENKKKNINGTTAVLHWEPSANYVTRFDGQPAHTRARASASFRWAREDEDERERASQPRCSRIWQLQWGESQSRSLSLSLPLSFVKFTYFAYELEHKTENEQKQRALRSSDRAWSVGRECAGRRTCNPAWGFPWFSASRVINGYVWGCFIDVPGEQACVGSAHSTRQNSKEMESPNDL